MNPEQWLSLKWNGGSTMSDRWLNQSKIIHFLLSKACPQYSVTDIRSLNLLLPRSSPNTKKSCCFINASFAS